MHILNIHVEIFLVYSSTRRKKSCLHTAMKKECFMQHVLLFKIIQEIEAFEFKIKVKVFMNEISVDARFGCVSG